MAWVYLDDHFPDHPKVVAAGGDAGWLFICGLAYVKRYATEGQIPKNQVARLSDRKAPTRLARRLVDVGLWHDEGDHYRIHDYRQWNRPQESRSAAARKAAEARWNKDAKRNADAYADALPDASETHSERMPDADASGCPPPLPQPTEDLTSSNGLTTTADTPDDDDRPQPSNPPPIIAQAVAILAARDLAARQAVPDLAPVADPLTWQNVAYDRRIAVAWPLVNLHRDHPDWTAQQIADFAEPPTAPTSPNSSREPRANAYDAQQAAAQARAERLARVAAGEACQECQDTGMTVDEDGLAVPCRHPETST